MASRKVGRPTDNPKPYRITVKFDEKCKEVLESYCLQKNVNKMEAARRGIMKLEDELEEK